MIDTMIDKMVDKYLLKVNASITDPIDHYTKNTLKPKIKSFITRDASNYLNLCAHSYLSLIIQDEDGNQGQLLGYFTDDQLDLLVCEFDNIFGVI